MDRLILVDSVQPVPTGWSPVLVKAGDVMLEEQTALALVKMIAEAETDGAGLYAFSGYRTAEYQRQLFMQSVHDYINDGVPEREAEALTSRYIAKPGHSEHETGLACDICAAGCDDADESFALSREGLWLHENAGRFGFILRYPRMKEHITGIAYEPWHFRYVGKEHSGIIMRHGLTLEEYLYYFGFKSNIC